jgi:prepilin-type N-terminal cleavage/methylation domain-containing protein
MSAMNKQGFTLLELAVVLGIIVILTHLAVREAGKWRTSQLRTVSDRGLTEIKEAILGADFERDAEGARVRTGFLADMGRLPQALTNAQGRLTLCELWSCPSPADSYDVRAADASNLVTTAEAADADGDVMVPCGWHGPYIRMPFAKTRLLDGWGNAYEVPDDANFTARIRASGNTPITGLGTPVAIIRNLGADGAPDDLRTPASHEAQDAEIVLDAGAVASLTVTVNACDSDGHAASGTYPCTVRVYGPQGGHIAVCKETVTLTAGTAHATVTGLTPGLRIMRVTCNGRKGLPRSLVIQPGANASTERIRVE